MPSERGRHLTSADELRSFVDAMPSDVQLLFDCDGVLWEGNRLYDGIIPTFQLLRSRGARVAFVSNNATASRAGYADKFHRLGLDWVTKEMVFTSGYAAAKWIKRKLLPVLPEESRRVYVIGQKGLEDELTAVGLDFTGGSMPEDNCFLPYQDFSSITDQPDVGVVLHAFDMHLNLKKYGKAYNILTKNVHARLVLTNADSSFLANGIHMPGEGLLASVLYSASKHDVIIVGKPEQPLLDILSDELGINPSKTYFFGDNLTTDIPFGKRGGFETVFCLSGVDKESALKDKSNDQLPDYILTSLGDLAVLEKP